jgi:telomerase reverse transcriptase
MVESLLSMPVYQTGKHVEMIPLGQLQRLDGAYVNPLPFKKYVAHGGAADVVGSFDRLVQDKFVGTKANTIFVNTAAQHFETKDDLMQLLREHVERNLVKIGKRFYRQKTGIPQGSILSTILCNFFYAELERDVLSFLALGSSSSESLLLRLLDDFCLITTNKEHAERFVRVMHRGHAEYGVTIRPSKSLASFDVVTDAGCEIPKCASGVTFPYCGVLLDMRTLEVSKNSERAALTRKSGCGTVRRDELTFVGISDSLTVDLGKAPGQSFHRKALKYVFATAGLIRCWIRGKSKHPA